MAFHIALIQQIQGGFAGICRRFHTVLHLVFGIFKHIAVYDRTEAEKTQDENHDKTDNISGVYTFEHSVSSGICCLKSKGIAQFPLQCPRSHFSSLLEQLELIAHAPNGLQYPLVGNAFQFLAQSLDVNIHRS